MRPSYLFVLETEAIISKVPLSDHQNQPRSQGLFPGLGAGQGKGPENEVAPKQVIVLIFIFL